MQGDLCPGGCGADLGFPQVAMVSWGAELGLGFPGLLRGCGVTLGAVGWVSGAPQEPLPLVWGRVMGLPEGAVKPRGVLVLLSGFRVPWGAVKLW